MVESFSGNQTFSLVLEILGKGKGRASVRRDTVPLDLSPLSMETLPLVRKVSQRDLNSKEQKRPFFFFLFLNGDLRLLLETHPGSVLRGITRGASGHAPAPSSGRKI